MEAIHLAYVLVFLLPVVFLLRLRRRGPPLTKRPATTTAHCPHPQRKLALHAFLSRSLRRFTDGVLDVHLRRLFLLLLDAASTRDGGAVDLQDALRRFGFRAICHVAFGVESVDGGDDDPATPEALFAAFDTAVVISFWRALTLATFVRHYKKLVNP